MRGTACDGGTAPQRDNRTRPGKSIFNPRLECNCATREGVGKAHVVSSRRMVTSIRGLVASI